MPSTTIADIRTIAIRVADQDAAVAFFVDTLGFDDPDRNRFYIVEG